jgi:hypothetical protein
MCVGCGGGGGGGDSTEEGTATPTRTVERTPTPPSSGSARTPTPAATAPDDPTITPVQSGGATPGPTATPAAIAATVHVDFAITTQDAFLGFQFTVLYPTSIGSFSGSGAHADCPLGASGIFVKNDQDDGHLILAAIDLSPYPGAFNLSCTFDVFEGQVLGPTDIGVTVDEVTRPDGTIGDPAKFMVAVDVH